MTTDPMHILILPMYYPEPSSSSHRGYMFYEQAMQIAKSGCRVGLAFVEQRSTTGFTWRRFFKESHFQLTAEDNGTFSTLRMHAWNTKLTTHIGGFIWSLLTLWLVWRYIRRYGKPDLVHAHFGQWAGYAAYLARKIFGIPYVVTEHASCINSKKRMSPKTEKILQKAYSNAQQIICVGTMLARNLRPYASKPERVTVIPNFVDTDTFKFSERVSEKEKHFVFISIGNLDKRKGFDELIHAFNQGFADKPHVSLVIVGDGEEYYPLLKLIDCVGLQRQIHLTGRLTREQVSWCLDESDAFVLASHNETFGIVLIEAMAAGLPAIGTICGGPEDIITPESGFLIEPGDPVTLADRMLETYDTYEQFDKARIRQSIIDRFDSRLAGRALTDVYRQVLTGSFDPLVNDIS